MFDISLAGLIGAIAGTVVAGITYHLLIGQLERRMQESARTPEERDKVEVQLSIIRRVVLTTDVIVFAALGYWIGESVWG